MAHDLEQMNGEVAFALRGKPAWHNLANAIYDEDQEVSASQIAKDAKLADWNIRLESISNFISDDYRNNSDSYLVVRTNPFDSKNDVLSIVGKRYQVVQNEQVLAFGDALVEGGAYWETAGSIKNGRVVFASLKLGKDIVIDSAGVNDKINMYLLLHSSHDGSTAVQASITPVRVVCQNTLNVALRSTKQSFKLRHTQSVDGKIAQARQALSLSFAYAQDFENLANELYSAPVSDKLFNEIILAAYPKPDKDAKGAIKKWENKVDVINEIYQSPTTSAISKTAWGAYNALTERLDYFRNGSGSKGTENAMASASGFDVATNVEKNRLLKVVKQLAVA